MVDKNDLRKAFSARLHTALDVAGVRSRGRGVDVQKQLKASGVSKTTQAISKWLNGEAIAESVSMVALSDWLNVRREWLEYGTPPMVVRNSSSVMHVDDDYEPHSPTRDIRFSKVPIANWEFAAAKMDLSRCTNSIFCPIPIGRNGFALKVEGESMLSFGATRSYPVGCLIFVDPDVEISPGDAVVAKLPLSTKGTFKILVEDAGRRYLQPLNPQYPMIEVTEDIEIRGKVIGTFIAE